MLILFSNYISGYVILFFIIYIGMNSYDISLICFVIVIVILLLFLRKKIQSTTPVLENPVLPPNWDEMPDEEKAAYVADFYIDKTEEPPLDETYIDKLPRDSECENKFAECELWAANGECMINPEYMFYNCQKSCETCALTADEKYNVVEIVNSKSPDGCVYHGESYPDPFAKMLDLSY